jgi:transposase
MSRRTKLTEEVIETASKLIRAGNYQKVVAQYIGVDESTWYRWLQKGEKAKNKRSIYYKFYKAVKKAEAEAHARNVAVIQQAAQTQWQAAAWWLERKYPELWGRKDKLGIGIDDEDGLKIEIVQVRADAPAKNEEGPADE